MKKHRTLDLFLSLLAVFFVMALSTCKKDGNTPPNITGTWNTTVLGTHGVVSQYHFKSDGSFEFVNYKIDTLSMNAIGYQSKLTGNYSISKTTLNFASLHYFINLNNTFGPVTDLTFIDGGPKTATYTIALNGQKNELLFILTVPLMPTASRRL